MAYSSKNLSVLAYGNAFTLWHYRSPTDLIAAIAASGYFNNASELVRVSDIVVIEDTNGATGMRRIATNNGTTVTVATLA